ncbi:hypothetical protein AB0M79_05010 [Polymorphospora sp. NPDC051019]|uniref:hypothetical protein n=1 Tax=Polymorphospora sp. NPDC051019 TaxID=3155725 RepID=UPI003442C493
MSARSVRIIGLGVGRAGAERSEVTGMSARSVRIIGLGVGHAGAERSEVTA